MEETCSRTVMDGPGDTWAVDSSETHADLAAECQSGSGDGDMSDTATSMATCSGVETRAGTRTALP